VYETKAACSWSFPATCLFDFICIAVVCMRGLFLSRFFCFLVAVVCYEENFIHTRLVVGDLLENSFARTFALEY